MKAETYNAISVLAELLSKEAMNSLPENISGLIYALQILGDSE